VAKTECRGFRLCFYVIVIFIVREVSVVRTDCRGFRLGFV
jgi:hypothetical protein